VRVHAVASGVASSGAPGRGPPRLPTSYFRGIAYFRFAIRTDSYSNSPRKFDIVQCGASDLVPAVDIDKIVALGDSPHCTKLRTVSENWGLRMYGRALYCAHCLISQCHVFCLKIRRRGFTHRGHTCIVFVSFCCSMSFFAFWGESSTSFSLSGAKVPGSESSALGSKSMWEWKFQLPKNRLDNYWTLQIRTEIRFIIITSLPQAGA